MAKTKGPKKPKTTFMPARMARKKTRHLKGAAAPAPAPSKK